MWKILYTYIQSIKKGGSLGGGGYHIYIYTGSIYTIRGRGGGFNTRENPYAAPAHGCRG